MGDRCTGRCCRDFRLPFTPASLHAAAAAARARREATPPPEPGAVHVQLPYQVEIEQIASMVVPVRPAADSKDAYQFSCVHIDDDGDCVIYKDRPQMCRNYPYGHACVFGDRCSWDAAREGAVAEVGRAVRHTRDPITFAIERVHLHVFPPDRPGLDDVVRVREACAGVDAPPIE